jgi:hypothetical protein
VKQVTFPSEQSHLLSAPQFLPNKAIDITKISFRNQTRANIRTDFENPSSGDRTNKKTFCPKNFIGSFYTSLFQRFITRKIFYVFQNIFDRIFAELQFRINSSTEIDFILSRNTFLEVPAIIFC